MRPPGGILAPGESLIATGNSSSYFLGLFILASLFFLCSFPWLSTERPVFKFVEHPENNEKPAVDQKSKVKFKIMSLKVKGEMDYVPELVYFLA